MSQLGDDDVNLPIRSPVQHLRVTSLPIATSTSRSTSRRNKRKNFQPRNIRTTGTLADDEEDDEDNNEDALDAANDEDCIIQGGESRLAPPICYPDSVLSDKSDKSDCNRQVEQSISISKDLIPLDLSESVGGVNQSHNNCPIQYIDESDATVSSRNSSRNSNYHLLTSSNDVNNATNQLQTNSQHNSKAINLSLRPTSTSDDSEGDDCEEDQVNAKNTDFNMRYLLWQQQQQQQSNGKVNLLSESSSASSTAVQQIHHLQDCVKQQLSNVELSSPSFNNHQHAEAMRELLRFYSLPKKTIAQQQQQQQQLAFNSAGKSIDSLIEVDFSYFGIQTIEKKGWVNTFV